MDAVKAQSLVDQLEDNIDDLEEALQPILWQALSESTKKLPLLDKAKLHTVIVYAIESLIFSHLKLNDVDPKEHAVFRELLRVKQYFEKIKNAEEGPAQPRENLSLNKQAAARIITHSLAGNDKFDLARLEREAREKVLAKRKLKDLETTMKERAQASESETQSIEKHLVDHITAELEKTGDLPIPTANSHEIEAEETKTSKKDRKRKHKEDEDVAANKQMKAKSSDAKAAKKARKKARKEAKSAAKATG